MFGIVESVKLQPHKMWGFVGREGGQAVKFRPSDLRAPLTFDKSLRGKRVQFDVMLDENSDEVARNLRLPRDQELGTS